MTELEKATKEYADGFERLNSGQDENIQSARIVGFKRGAEWQAKRSPWISVEERLPEGDQMVLCQMKSNDAIVSAYIYINDKGKPQTATDPSFEFDDFQHYEPYRWMPIPE